MSTTFGVLKPESDNIEDKYIPVAFRWATSGDYPGMKWLNEIAYLLPQHTPVFPMDNTAQGIFTIGDIKKAIKKYNE